LGGNEQKCLREEQFLWIFETWANFLDSPTGQRWAWCWFRNRRL